MKYKKCARCELNYVTGLQKLCAVCIDEINGKKDDFDVIGWDTCPFCDKNCIKNGEEMCCQCKQKRQKAKYDNQI